MQQATRDSVRAIMLIRAYRVRGHLHAKLDPLDINPRPNDQELHPSHYGFTEADWDRKIFLDNVLGLEFGTIREIVAILERTYCQTLGVEFMHISDPVEKAWIQERIEGPDKEITFTTRRQARHPQQARRGGRLREVPGRAATPAPSASASTAASRSSRRSSRSSSAAAISA